MELPPLPVGIDLGRFIDTTECPKSLSFDTHREPNALGVRDYGDFIDGLEDLHNQGQCYVGGRCGDLSHVPFAAFDPTFGLIIV